MLQKLLLPSQKLKTVREARGGGGGGMEMESGFLIHTGIVTWFGGGEKKGKKSWSLEHFKKEKRASDAVSAITKA